MSRIRTVKPEFFKHEDIFDAELETGLPLRLAFIGLWCECDREGRFKWKARSLKSSILPFDEIDFSRVLDALATRGFLVKYMTETGDLCGFIPSFLKHQHINGKEMGSKLPDPDDCDLIDCNSDTSTGESRVDHALSTRPGNSQGERKGREGKGKEGNRERKGTPPNPQGGIIKKNAFTDEFEQFWKITTFPKKQQDTKGDMKKKYLALRKQGVDAQKIYDACEIFSKAHAGDIYAIGMRKFLDADTIQQYLDGDIPEKPREKTFGEKLKEDFAKIDAGEYENYEDPFKCMIEE